MSSEIKERQKLVKNAIEALQNKNQEISTLQEKKRQFDMGEVSIATEAKTIRKKTLLDFVFGRAVKDDVDSADEAVSKAERDDRLASEMIETIEDSIKKMEAQIPIYQNAVGAAKTKLWEGIYDTIKQEVQAAVKDLPILAMAAGSRIGKQYQTTLLDLFGGSIHFTVIDEAARRLEKEYGLDD